MIANADQARRSLVRWRRHLTPLCGLCQETEEQLHAVTRVRFHPTAAATKRTCCNVPSVKGIPEGSCTSAQAGVEYRLCKGLERGHGTITSRSTDKAPTLDACCCVPGRIPQVAKPWGLIVQHLKDVRLLWEAVSTSLGPPRVAGTDVIKSKRHMS